MQPQGTTDTRGHLQLVMCLVALLGCGAMTPASAQSPSSESPAAHQEPPGSHSEPSEEFESPPLEAELVASTIFQSGLFSLRLGSPLILDTHWFGLDGNDAGIFGLA